MLCIWKISHTTKISETHSTSFRPEEARERMSRALSIQYKLKKKKKKSGWDRERKQKKKKHTQIR